MSKLKPDDDVDSDQEPEDFDLKHSFYRTFQENHLEFLCNRIYFPLKSFIFLFSSADEIVPYQDSIKKTNFDLHNDSYSFEMRENSFLKLSHTPIKAESTPQNMRVFQKIDYNLKFNEEFNDSWSFQRPNNPLNNRPPRENESYSFNENPKQGFECPLSSIWHGDHENMKNINKNYDIFNGNAQNFEQIIDKKSQQTIKEENNAKNHEGTEFNGKIPFHMFKKPTPMFQKKTSQTFVTPLKNTVSPSI